MGDGRARGRDGGRPAAVRTMYPYYELAGRVQAEVVAMGGSGDEGECMATLATVTTTMLAGRSA